MTLGRSPNLSVPWLLICKTIIIKLASWSCCNVLNDISVVLTTTLRTVLGTQYMWAILDNLLVHIPHGHVGNKLYYNVEHRHSRNTPSLTLLLLKKQSCPNFKYCKYFSKKLHLTESCFLLVKHNTYIHTYTFQGFIDLWSPSMDSWVKSPPLLTSIFINSSS